MKKILIILLLIFFIIFGVFVLRKKSNPENPLRAYVQNHQPYQDFPDISYAVYITPEEKIITYDKKSETYWKSSLIDFINILLPKLCGGECKDPSTAASTVKLYSIGIDADKKLLQLTLVDKASLESTHPTFFDVEAGFDGSDAHVAE